MPFQLHIALRTLWKQKLFTAINLFGLAASLCCSLLVGSHVHQELLHHKYHSKAECIYGITQLQNQEFQQYHVAITPGLQAS